MESRGRGMQEKGAIDRRVVPSLGGFCGECATGVAKSGSPAGYTFEPLTMRRYGTNP